MSYQVTSAKMSATSAFWIGGETGALYVKTPNGKMLCVDDNNTWQLVGREYSSRDGTYRPVLSGQTLTIKVGEK